MTSLIDKPISIQKALEDNLQKTEAAFKENIQKEYDSGNWETP